MAVDPFGMFNNAMTAFQKVKDVADAHKLADLNLALADLKNSLADMRMELVTRKEENLQLSEELKKANAKKEQPVEFRENVYWYTGDPPAGLSKGPFCTRGYEVDGKLLTLAETNSVFGRYRCNICRTDYGPKDRSISRGPGFI